MMKEYEVFIFAGEPSGDHHAAAVISAANQLGFKPNWYGVPGKEMRALGVKSLIDMEQFQVMGYTDVLFSLPRLIRNFYIVLNSILEKKPDIVVLVDYPGFNLRLAKKLRKKGYQGRIIQYISPSVWAYKQKRIQTMSQTLDLLLVIYPFEVAYFANSTLEARYVGNPLVAQLQQAKKQMIHNEYWKVSNAIALNQKVVAVFPGSRLGELKRNLPVQLNILKGLKDDYSDLVIAISCKDWSKKNWMIDLAVEVGLKEGKDFVMIPEEQTLELMSYSDIALAKSGTVTLELALLQKPTVVLYQLSRLNHWIAKYILRLQLPYYCIVNILSNKEVFPEFFSSLIDQDAVKNALKKIYTDQNESQRIQQDCLKVAQILGEQEAHKNVVHAIKELIG